MEDDLVPGADGYYCLCVFGVSSMNDEALTEIFNKYGEVVRITRSNSLGFVRFQEYEEAKAAIEGMNRDYPNLGTRMAHNKNLGAKPRTDSGRNFGERNNTDGRGDGSRIFGDRNNTEGRGDGSRNSGDRNNTEGRGDGSRNSGDRNNTEGKGDGSRSYGENHNTDGRGDGARSFYDRNNTNRYENANGLRRPKSKTPSLKEVGSDDGKDSMPALKFNEKTVEGMPDLVPRGEPAKQLIIANLPRSIMQYQVYNLCKSRNPLHVDIFTTYSNITYAHVHVKNTADIDELQKELNGLTINDTNLAVISVEQLLAEYSASGRPPIKSGKK